MNLFRAYCLLGVLLLTFCNGALADQINMGSAAFGRTKKILEFGPRPSGSDAYKKVIGQVETWFKEARILTKRQPFTATTPIGKIAMENLMAIIPGKENKLLILACHLESKYMPNIKFLGANDAASACALLVELAIRVKTKALKHTVWVVFFDGEEAFKQWSAEDSLYGSRYFVKDLISSSIISSIAAFILLDMIGDKDLQVARESRADKNLVSQVACAARELGYSKHFFTYQMPIADDHLPFLQAGVPTIDLIDFKFGPIEKHGTGKYFHTAADDIDKLSPKSLDIVGKVVLQTLLQLDGKHECKNK